MSSYAEQVSLGAIEEFLACSMCGCDSFRLLFKPGNRKQVDGWSYRVVYCQACGFLGRNPNIRPERLAELYADSYSTFLNGSYAEKRQRRYQLTMDAFSPVLKKVTDADFLTSVVEQACSSNWLRNWDSTSRAPTCPMIR